MAEGSLLSAAKSSRKYGFALTPLADAMFQLLVFFMLSSSLAPYSLITLKTASAGSTQTPLAPDTPPEARPETKASPGASVLWHLSAGALRSGQNTLPLEALDPVAEALLDQGVQQVILFTTRTATVQDVATVLETLTAHGIPRVQLVSTGGG